MKILTSESGKIISFGEHVFKAGTSVIVDTDEMTIAEISNLMENNEMVMTAKKKADIISQLEGQLAVTYTEVSEMSDTEKFEKIVVDGFASEMSDNDIKRQLFNADCDFDEINKTFNAIVKDKALRLSPKDRTELANVFLEGYIPEDVESHLAKVSALQDHLNCTSTQAGASMRKWAKANEIELPKAPKTPKRVPGFAGNVKIVADWALANPDCTREQLDKFAEDHVPATKTGQANWSGHANTVWNAILFAKSMYGVEEATESFEDEEVA